MNECYAKVIKKYRSQFTMHVLCTLTTNKSRKSFMVKIAHTYII